MSQDLARRAVACKGWRWMPGMLVRYGDGKAWYRLTDGDGYGLPFKYVPPNPRDAWPDLTDPATLGCLLALVREAWGDPHAYCAPRRASIIGGFLCGPGWYVWVAPEFLKGGEYWPSPTEVEALVAALEAAP